jgi:hypothetical protein
MLRSIIMKTVSEKTAHSIWPVGKTVTAKASHFDKIQQLSTNDSQQVQYQSLKNLKFQYASISSGIWFGTRGIDLKEVL